MKFTYLIFIAVLVVFPACKTQKQTIVDPRENLNTTIADLTNLLEKEDYKPMFEKYILPENLEMILSMKTIDEVVAGFSKKKASRLLDALKTVKNATPKYDETGNLATFAKEDIEGLSKTMIFKKVEKYWYIAN